MRSDRLNARQRGFTLLELLISLTVVGIIATYSVSSYRNYIIRANRSEGTAMLLRIQVAEEKFFLQNGTYTVAIAVAPPVGLGLSATSQPNAYYNLAIGAGLTGAIATSYAATATAAATGPQVKDAAACQALSIDDQSNRTPTTASGCWK